MDRSNCWPSIKIARIKLSSLILAATVSSGKQSVIFCLNCIKYVTSSSRSIFLVNLRKFPSCSSRMHRWESGFLVKRLFVKSRKPSMVKSPLSAFVYLAICNFFCSRRIRYSKINRPSRTKPRERNTVLIKTSSEVVIHQPFGQILIFHVAGRLNSCLTASE